MVAAQAGGNHGDEWDLTWYLNEGYLHRPGNLASLRKRSIVTVFVHLAEMMKQIFVSLRYWQKWHVNDGN